MHYKTVFLMITGILLSSQLNAEETCSTDNMANFDSESRIITFPKVSADNEQIYNNAELRLNKDGSWEILAISMEPEPEPIQDISGEWTGFLHGTALLGMSLPHICPEPLKTSLVLSQQGEVLTGTAWVGDDEGSGCPHGGEAIINGEVSESGRVEFTLEIGDGFYTYRFIGNLYDNDTTLIGSAEKPEKGERAAGEWELTLQE